jgi:Na+/H+-dicarboxylate symporter/ABC-type amino acid transport substrate-binding protein
MRLSLSSKILIGLGVGILAGFVFGEKTAFLKMPGDAFILLLQMTVLPYIMVSLIAGLGGLSFQAAASIGRKCGLVLLLLWTLGLLMVLITPLAFPKWEMASFFSTSLVEQSPPFNLLGLYIPSNLFHSLSNNVVPAVVVFSLALGIALIGLEEKDVFLNSLSVIARGLGFITHFLIRLAPIGVFAIIASATGSMRFAELERLQVYMVAYVVAALLLTFWVLPGLVTSLTPLKYKDLIAPARPALITAFATGNIFVVLPVLAEKSKELLRTLDAGPQDSESTVDVIISTSFSFPNLGKILTLSFVLFAGWFSNAAVAVSSYPTLASTGLFSFFGDPNVAIPFLLDLLHIPSDTYRFFPMVDNLVGVRFGTLLAAMYTLTLAVLGASAVAGRLRMRWPKILRYAFLTVVLTVCSLGATRWFFEYIVGHDYQEYDAFVAMDLSRERTPATVYASPSQMPGRVGQESRLIEIRERGCLRVGYFKDALPFAFTNAKGRLVGFDVEMAYTLAHDMNTKLELAPVDRDKAATALDAGHLDIIMSGIAVSMENARRMTLSSSYLDQTLALVVKDYRREDFNSRRRLKNLERLKVGILDVPYYVVKVKEYLPQAEVVLLNSPREFFVRKEDDLDAFVYSAEAGSAWSLIYPEYTVAVPQPDVLRVPLAYAMPRGDRELADFVNNWIDLKKKDLTITELYNYWILGRNAVEQAPRWSVIRNVLHLVD